MKMTKLDAVKEVFCEGRRERVTVTAARRIGFALGVLGLTEAEVVLALDHFEFPNQADLLTVTAIAWSRKGSRPESLREVTG